VCDVLSLSLTRSALFSLGDGPQFLDFSAAASPPPFSKIWRGAITLTQLTGNDFSFRCQGELPHATNLMAINLSTKRVCMYICITRGEIAAAVRQVASTTFQSLFRDNLCVRARERGERMQLMQKMRRGK
jgi:hypothetical protein